MGSEWTMKNSLPGGDFLIHEKKELVLKLQKYPFLDQICSNRFINYYGTLSFEILKM